MSKLQRSHQPVQNQTASKNAKPEPKPRSSIKPGQLTDFPETLRHEDVINAQQQLGNQVVQRALDQSARRKGVVDAEGNLKEELSSQIQQKRGSGTPLPPNIQTAMSSRLGHNFDGVRIHTDATADKISRAINARAFTIGRDVFFKNGVFAPHSSQGRETLIHELTHVVQQSGSKGASGKLQLGAPDTVHEKEADQMGKKHAQQASARGAVVQKQSAPTISRKADAGVNDGNALEQEADQIGLRAGIGGLSGIVPSELISPIYDPLIAFSSRVIFFLSTVTLSIFNPTAP